VDPVVKGLLGVPCHWRLLEGLRLRFAADSWPSRMSIEYPLFYMWSIKRDPPG
jgi:hypothetical protein